jgi:hypothetical protein
MWLTHMPLRSDHPAAQPGAVADAAVRRARSRDFEGWFSPTAVPIYACGAAKRQAVRRQPITSVPSQTSVQHLSPSLYGFVSESIRPDNLRMVEDGVFDRGQVSCAINLWDIQTKYADVIPWQHVIEQMDKVSAKLSPPREVCGEEVAYAVCARQ